MTFIFYSTFFNDVTILIFFKLKWVTIVTIIVKITVINSE